MVTYSRYDRASPLGARGDQALSGYGKEMEHLLTRLQSRVLGRLLVPSWFMCLRRLRVF